MQGFMVILWGPDDSYHKHLKNKQNTFSFLNWFLLSHMYNMHLYMTQLFLTESRNWALFQWAGLSMSVFQPPRISSPMTWRHLFFFVIFLFYPASSLLPVFGMDMFLPGVIDFTSHGHLKLQTTVKPQRTGPLGAKSLLLLLSCDAACVLVGFSVWMKERHRSTIWIFFFLLGFEDFYVFSKFNCFLC